MSIETTKQSLIALMRAYEGNYDWSAIDFDCFDLSRVRSDIHAEIETSTDVPNGEPITRHGWHITRYTITVHPMIVPSLQRGKKGLADEAFSKVLEDLSHIFFDQTAGVINQMTIRYLSGTKLMEQTEIEHRPCKIVTEWEVLHNI